MRQSKERVWCVLGPSRFQLTAKRAEGKKLKTCLAGRRVSEAAGHDVAGPGPAPRLVPWLRRSVKCSAVPRHTEASGHSGGGPPAPTRTESRHRCPTPCVADAARATALARTGGSRFRRCATYRTWSPARTVGTCVRKVPMILCFITSNGVQSE